ncbi:MAG: hypothetical protein JXM74_08055 [Fusobacteriaceae bacterium]|nr:hypothetical protein [Fusobacteriaceae bacterium]MBN2838694.1 hypothetical protein [Fusobacteriaceae bacterium]
MKKKLLLLASLILTANVYSQEIIKTEDGFSLGFNSFINLGVSNETIKVENYENSKTFLNEDTAFFQFNMEKKWKQIESKAHLRYGATGFEYENARLGGDLSIKYNFNDKLYAQFNKLDFGYLNVIRSNDWSAVKVEGKNLGSGVQLELAPDGMMIDQVLNKVEVDYGVIFLGTGNIKPIDKSGVNPGGAIWSSHMAYVNNVNNHDIKPYAFNFGYSDEKLKVDTSLVYANRKVTGNSEDIDATNKGITLKGNYKLNEKSKIGLGFSYGEGDANSSNDSNDINLKVVSTNAWYTNNIKGYDLFIEFAHSNSNISEDSFNTRNYVGKADKTLDGAYIKVSKFTKYGIPAIETKVAQSVFSKVNGSDYISNQKNTLVEIKPSFTVISKKMPGLFYGISGTIGKYDVENYQGTLGNDKDSTQYKLSTNITYIY